MTKNKFRYWQNSAWMILEKLLRMAAAILTSVLFARYLGPSLFGDLNYVIAFVALFLPIAEFGMSSILVRDFIENEGKKRLLLGSSFYLILILSFIIFFLLNILSLNIEEEPTLRKWIFTYSTIVLLKPWDIVDFYFQAEVRARIPALCKSISIILALILKVYFVLKGAPMIYILYAFVIEFLLLALLYALVFWKYEKLFFLNTFDKYIFKGLLKSAWPIVLSALSVILYMRIDQLMLKKMVNSTELGLYSSAIRLYEGYLSLIIVLSLSLTPAIISLKKASQSKYNEGFTKLFKYVFWGNNLTALIITFLAPFIIRILYGQEYEGAKTVFAIIFWASSLASMGSLSARYLVIEGMEKKQAVRTIVALFVNIFLNYILIPKYGKEGAAISTIISLLIGNYLIDYFDKDLRELLNMKNKGILLKKSFK